MRLETRALSSLPLATSRARRAAGVPAGAGAGIAGLRERRRGGLRGRSRPDLVGRQNGREQPGAAPRDLLEKPWMHADVLRAINVQINSELTAWYQYLAMAAFCEREKFTGAARW